MTEPGVHTAIRDGVLEIVLARPPVNAINAAASRALTAAFERFRDDRTLRVVILTGAGATFSAGLDLKEVVSGGDALGYGSNGFGGLTELFDLDKPVICAVNGPAIGGGFELVLAADLVVATRNAWFALPEVRLGVVADAGGAIRLTRRLPYAVAMEVLLAGGRLTAVEAQRHGLVNHLASPEELLPMARRLALAVIEGAPLAIAATKRLVADTAHLSIEQAYTRRRAGTDSAYARIWDSADAAEGLRAFLEKRRPRFTGA